MNILLTRTQRVIKTPINPLDVSTIVSVYPKRIVEIKPTIHPSTFVIPKGSYESPAVVHIHPSSWWKEIDQDQPLLEIPVSSIMIADSIVKDYCNGLLECNMVDVMPGLFFLPGEISYDKILTEYKPLLKKAEENQKRWYMALVQEADVLWSRTNGNPRAISDDMRLAARELGFESKAWLKDYQHVEMVKCMACGTFNQGDVVVCPNCKVVLDRKRFEELKLSFANQ